MSSCDGTEGETRVIYNQSAEPRVSNGSILWQIVTNLPSELQRFGSIPCAQQSLYTGIIVGGVSSAILIAATGKCPSRKSST